MALPKEPRQKMINLMYLVLTALLALNVSAEILNAFMTVNNSLSSASTTIEEKNKTVFSSFDSLIADPKTSERAKVWKVYADKAKSYSDAAVAYIQGLQVDLKKASGLNPTTGEYQLDELEEPTRILADPGVKGGELYTKLLEFKNNLLNISDSIKKEFEHSLPLDLKIVPKKGDSSIKVWKNTYFNMVPTIAAVTILSKFENDVRNSEAMVVDYCLQQVGSVKFILDQYQPLVGQSSGYLMPGQELIITAGIGAYSKAVQPSITIDGQSVLLNDKGVAEYKTTVGSAGGYTKKVHISFTNQATGKPDFRDYEVQYTVGSPTNITVSADKVRVLYIGLVNPISITGGPKGAESIMPSISQGTLKDKGNGQYDAEVQTPGTATITVKTTDGKSMTSDFKVKTVPNPTPKVGNSAGGRMKINDFKSQVGLRADLADFIFEGVKFDVVSYTLIGTGKGFEQTGPQPTENNGAYFSDASKRIIEMAKPGASIIFDNIKVSGPGGTRTLPPTVFTLIP